MPDWLRDIVVALIGGLFGAGGFAGIAQVLKARSDAHLAIEAQQDEHTLKLYQSLNASEDVFRKAVLGAYESEVKARHDLEARLAETQKQLTIITGERDLFKRQLEQAQADLSAAHTKIRHLESEIAQLQAQQKEHS